ncbi:MAG TPA: pyridoxamine 5'-phosphate oxidase family protein [bacterium]|nr:pyridoxamine 5'-phosphate oxidase family protein [bacterium]
MSRNEPVEYLPLRKKKRRMSEQEAWELLVSRRTEYGCLGTHGVAAENGMPYCIPMNFAADPAGKALFLHTTIDTDSKRNLAIEQNPAVTFVVVDPGSVIRQDADGTACRYSMDFTSVMVFGIAEKIEDPSKKAAALNLMMMQKTTGDFIEVEASHTAIATIYKINVDHISGAKK